MRIYRFKKKDFTLGSLAEVLEREFGGNPDLPVVIVSTFTYIEVRVGEKKRGSEK